MTRVLVAGHTGNIGSRVVNELLEDERISAVLCLARSAGPTATGKLSTVAADLSDPDPGPLAGIMARWRPDAVINCTGTVLPEISTLAKAHVTTTAALIRSTRSVPSRVRFVQIGSAAEYGSACEENASLSEDAWPEPCDDYGVSKLASTALVLAHARLGLDATVLRVFNLLAPTPAPNSLFGRITQFLQGGGEERRMLLLHGVPYRRDFVDVRDVARGIVAAVHAPAVAGEVINIASGSAVAVGVVAQEILRAAGSLAAVGEGGRSSGRSEAVTWQRADIGKARRLLGWEPLITRDQSVHYLAASLPAAVLRVTPDAVV